MVTLGNLYSGAVKVPGDFCDISKELKILTKRLGSGGDSRRNIYVI
jgi:hypothetical protein